MHSCTHTHTHTHTHIRSTVQILTHTQLASGRLLRPADLAPSPTTITTIVNTAQYVFTLGFQNPGKKMRRKKKKGWKNEGMCQTAGTLSPYYLFASICLGLSLRGMRQSNVVGLLSVCHCLLCLFPTDAKSRDRKT